MTYTHMYKIHSPFSELGFDALQYLNGSAPNMSNKIKRYGYAAMIMLWNGQLKKNKYYYQLVEHGTYTARSKSILLLQKFLDNNIEIKNKYFTRRVGSGFQERVYYVFEFKNAQNYHLARLISDQEDLQQPDVRSWRTKSLAPRFFASNELLELYANLPNKSKNNSSQVKVWMNELQ